MVEHARAPLSIALPVSGNAGREAIAGALEDWLWDEYGLPLDSAESHDTVVDWLQSAPEELPALRLAVSDDRQGSKRTVTFFCDDQGPAILIEDLPLRSSDSPRTTVDVPHSTLALVRRLLEVACPSIDHLQALQINHGLDKDLASTITRVARGHAPGLILLVVSTEMATPTKVQADLADQLRGVGLIVTATPVQSTALLDRLGYTGEVRPGTVASIARTGDAPTLGAEVVPSFSLRRQPQAAKRLILRHQLAASIPFELERRRLQAQRILQGGPGDIDLPAALQLLDEEQFRANELHQRLADAQLQLEHAWEEQDEALAELDATQSRLRYLERQFIERGEVPIGNPAPDDDWIPETCSDAVAGARELLEFIVMTADESDVDALDRQPKRALWAKKVWLSLRALNDYVRSKAEGRFDGDLTKYRQDPPPYAIPLLCEYAPTESETTQRNPITRNLRVFRVDRAIDASGAIYMGAHIKVDRGGTNAPRIHFLDDSGGATQRLYVGYIGPHLATHAGY